MKELIGMVVVDISLSEYEWWLDKENFILKLNFFLFFQAFIFSGCFSF
jgi:hypothetical protein